MAVASGSNGFQRTKYPHMPPYPIHGEGGKSHEATCKDIINGTSSNKSGLQKLTFCGSQAKADGLDRSVWIVSKVNSTDNALQFRWHLPPDAAADNNSNREAVFALV
jgi:hypothetical protein